MYLSNIIDIFHFFHSRTKWKRSTSLGLELLSERLNYSALHGLRHVGALGSGLFAAPNLLNGYNRSLISSNPLHPISASNMMLYNNASNHMRPFHTPSVSSPSPYHSLSNELNMLAAVAAGSSAPSNLAAAAMQAAAAQAAGYQSSFKSARPESLDGSIASPLALASLSRHQGELDRQSFLSGLSTALASSSKSSIHPKN